MRFAKHSGLGNSFLVLIDPERAEKVDGEVARAACAEAGTDGLIRAAAAPGGSGADVAMELWNADGSRAELSGNGLRCVAQAVLRAHLAEGPNVVVLTDAGPRRTVVEGDPQDATVTVRVDMGTAEPLDETAPEWLPAAQKAAAVSMGNPHRVLLLAGAAEVDEAVAALPPIPDVNVELVTTGPGPDEITMRVVERGVGETLACGTGACAAAWAARQWGLTGPTVTVHQRGGDATVEVGETLTLVGPATFEEWVELPCP